MGRGTHTDAHRTSLPTFPQLTMSRHAFSLTWTPSPLLECRWVSLTGNGKIKTSSNLYVVFMWSPIPRRGSLHALKSPTFTFLTGWKKVTRHKNMVCVCLCVRFCSFSRSILQANASKHTWKSERDGLNKQHAQICQAPAIGYKLIFMLSIE